MGSIEIKNIDETGELLGRLNWLVRARLLYDDEGPAAAQFQMTKFEGWSAAACGGITYAPGSRPFAKDILEAMLRQGAEIFSISTFAYFDSTFFPIAKVLTDTDVAGIESAVASLFMAPYAVVGLRKGQFRPVACVFESPNDDYAVCAGPTEFLTDVVGDIGEAHRDFLENHFHDSDREPEECGTVFGKKIVSALEYFNRADTGYTVVFPE